MSAKGLSISRSAEAFLKEQLAQLGQVSAGERNVLVVFAATVVLWSAPGAFAMLGISDSPFARWYAAALPEGVVAILGALLLFVLPVDWRTRTFTLSWPQATRIDWGVLVLFGGGLAVVSSCFRRGWPGLSVKA